MLNRRRSCLALCLLLALCSAAPLRAENQDPASLWADFNHYVLIARPDLAKSTGEALLAGTDATKLLDIVEHSEYSDYQTTLDRASKIDALKPLAAELTKRIQEARIGRSREPARIQADIQQLAQGARPSRNAIDRLRASGQYAAPALLNVLLDENQKKLQPYVLDAMVAIGKPLVAPLSEALVGLEPVPQGQVAHVLAEIGYPRAIPALKQVIENPRTDASARAIVEGAYKQLSRNANLPSDLSAAELYLRLAQNLYASATVDPKQVPDLDMATMTGLVWSYSSGVGLQYVAVPSEIYGDVLAMNAALRALKLSPDLDAALSVWLTANLRRANRLPEGKKDPSYTAAMLPPMFYAQAAGPLRLQDVLDTALADGDTRLALNAIDALSNTAGTDALVNRQGNAQPLLKALSYPDRRVRFAAAFTFTNARPKQRFPGSDRVVPVLAEAVRQSDTRYALVIGSDAETANKLRDVLAKLNYQASGGTSVRQASDATTNEPGVDLLVTNLDAAKVDDLVHATQTNYKLAAVPILVLTTPGDQIALNARYGAAGRVRSALWSNDPAGLRSAVEQTVQSYAGKSIDAKEALDYATTALNLLSTVAVGAGDVFNVSDAQAALIRALADQRASIATLAAKVLAKINSPDAQQAIADAALDITRPEAMRVQLLGSLAESATMFGNKLSKNQLDQILKLVRSSTGDIAIAAARTHGALTLPTSDVVQMILK